MNDLIIREMANDCAILLERALADKSIACFGIDGFGLHGQTDQAQTYPIDSFTIQIFTDETDVPLGRLVIELEGYSAARFGHVMTDKNFEFSLNQLLQETEIDPTCWNWAWDLVDDQPENGVILEIDPIKLLSWY